MSIQHRGGSHEGAQLPYKLVRKSLFNCLGLLSYLLCFNQNWQLRMLTLG